MYYPSKLPIVKTDELRKTRPFTLTSGYDDKNSRFVRVADGYSVQADPAAVKKEKYGQVVYEPHHIRHEGCLYRCHPGYVMATLKEGRHGWSEVVEQDHYWTAFNPWKDMKVEFVLDEEYNFEIQVSSMVTGNKIFSDREVKDLGTWSLFNGAIRKVKSPIFKGLRTLLRRVRFLAEERFPFHYGGYSFNRDLTQYYDLGEIITLEKSLSFEHIVLEFNKNFPRMYQIDSAIMYDHENNHRPFSQYNTVLVVTSTSVFKARIVDVDWGGSLNLCGLLYKTVVEPLEESRPINAMGSLREGLVKKEVKNLVVAYRK